MLKRLGEETILYSEELNSVNYTEVISLNNSAAFLIGKSQGLEFTIDIWAELLVEEYNIDINEALSDVELLVNKMYLANLIEE